MDVHDGRATGEQIGDRFNVNFWVGADRPVAVDFLQLYLGIRPALDFLRITNVDYPK
jgi:hypothetical protein